MPGLRTSRIALLPILGLVAGCNVLPGAANDPDVLASVINVTPFELTAILSGVLGDEVDTVTRTVGPSASADVRFVCVDEVVVGDPLDPALAGVVVNVDGEDVELAPFTVLEGESYACGDVLEIIVSGTSADALAIDVFALTPP